MLAPRVRLAVALVLTLALLGGGAAALWQRHAFAAVAPPAQKAPAGKAPAPARDEAGARVVTGRVLGPDGKPIRGAKVYVSPYTYKDHGDPRGWATTDARGRFRLTARKVEVDRNDTVVAVAGGFGPDWVALGQAAAGAEMTLRLVKDVPITGRVLDLEGRPVAGVAVRVVSVRKLGGEDLSAFVKGLLEKPGDGQAVHDAWRKHRRQMSTVWGVLGTPRSVPTGKDGRFRLAGLGRERIVSIQVEGPTIAHAGLYVLTRPGLKGLPPGTHGATFDHLAGPTKPIRGTVTDRRTGKPVAGVHVNGQPDNGDSIGEGVSAQTDAQGRFTLVGLPKARRYHLNVGGAPYVWTDKELADTPGLEPIRARIEVERALALRVRVVDRATGRPVRALIQYSVRSGNPSLDRYVTFRRNAVGWNLNDPDGWLTQTVLPGPALIAVQAQEGEFTRARQGSGDPSSRFSDSVVPQPLFLDFFHAVVPVHPKEADPKSLVLTVALDPGRSVRGRLVDPDGKPLEGVQVAGLNAVKREVSRTSQRLAGASFTATGLEPAHPRLLAFFHAGRKLAAAVTLRGDERGVLTMRLEPLGTLTGRLVDARGRPVEAEVVLEPGRRIAATLPGELIMGGLGNLRDVFANRSTTTDNAGRFRVEGLVAGMKYDLWWRGKDGRFRGPLKDDLAAPPGKTVDLGDVPNERAQGKKRAKQSAKD